MTVKCGTKKSCILCFMQRNAPPPNPLARWGRGTLITARYPAEARGRFPTSPPLPAQPARLTPPKAQPGAAFQLSSPARGACFSPRSLSQSQGSGKAVVHSSYSEPACDSQQISDTQPKFRQVLGCSDVDQRLANSKKTIT